MAVAGRLHSGIKCGPSTFIRIESTRSGNEFWIWVDPYSIPPSPHPHHQSPEVGGCSLISGPMALRSAPARRHSSGSRRCCCCGVQKKRCYNWCWDGFDMVWVCWGWFKSDFMHISIIIYLDPPFVPTKTVYFYLILDILVPSSSILQGMNFGGSRSW